LLSLGFNKQNNLILILRVSRKPFRLVNEISEQSKALSLK
jgi:hypothetical protein